jgi:hypothetical protein
MVLKHVRKKKKSNCFAYLTLTTLTSVSGSTECSEEVLVTAEDITFFSDTGEGHYFSFASSFISRFLVNSGHFSS